jgi:restriction system protein
MNNRIPDSPWNPGNSVQVTPKEYEMQVVEWISQLGSDLNEFRVEHLVQLPGTGGEYEIDAVAEFSIFQGARIVVLVECKRYNRPVEREVVLSLSSKLHDVGAHKAMIFSTSGFQKGALEYASAHGIATITFIDGKSTYETRARFQQSVEPPQWINFPKYSGLFLNYHDNRLYSSLVGKDSLEIVQAWLRRDAGIA